MAMSDPVSTLGAVGGYQSGDFASADFSSGGLDSGRFLVEVTSVFLITR